MFLNSNIIFKPVNRPHSGLKRVYITNFRAFIESLHRSRTTMHVKLPPDEWLCGYLFVIFIPEILVTIIKCCFLIFSSYYSCRCRCNLYNHTSTLQQHCRTITLNDVKLHPAALPLLSRMRSLEPLRYW